jgi:regulator of nucleoside diphosphate kinase
VNRRKESNVNKNLVISSFDKERLGRVLRQSEDADLTADLQQEIERAGEVQPEEVPPDVVTMNSTVRVSDLDSGEKHEYTIVFPPEADAEMGRISILSPIGTALLGYRLGDVVPVARLKRQLRIDEIVYQPEAAGDFHL